MGAKHSFREGIRVFCREGRRVMSVAVGPGGKGLALDHLIRPVPVSSLIIETECNGGQG